MTPSTTPNTLLTLNTPTPRATATSRPAARGVASPFDFVSSVDANLWKDVEALFYFHPRQPLLIDSIKACVDEFGAPEILQGGERIRVGIPKNGAQCLFACHRERRPGVPVGVVVYLRTSAELLQILHLAVHPAYEQTGHHAEFDLALQLVNEVRTLARRIAGVRRVQLPYRQAGFLTVPRLRAAT
ncbi:MAG: hypothetical protein HZC37_03105 [Burkholderiales bacterium]|nr:hypothetical protein [Burkholderiales bacterium]